MPQAATQKPPNTGAHTDTHRKGGGRGARKRHPLLHAGGLFVTQSHTMGITNASEAAAAPTTHPLHIHTDTCNGGGVPSTACVLTP